ncbi:MAG: hydrogenase/urease nickel incorporation protein HypA [Campylobacterales bacterium]|nr:hydrogenase/urease nickel incorporation protein HypA [Campylobacterales bacterium]
MHEYSIVQSLLNSCEEHASANKASKVTKVVVKIGVMSGVEPDLLQTAFDTFKETTICEDAKFVINIQPVVIECNQCHEESTLEKNEYSCPKCASTDLKIVDGEDMFLMSLELE